MEERPAQAGPFSFLASPGVGAEVPRGYEERAGGSPSAARSECHGVGKARGLLESDAPAQLVTARWIGCPAGSARSSGQCRFPERRGHRRGDGGGASGKRPRRQGDERGFRRRLVGPEQLGQADRKSHRLGAQVRLQPRHPTETRDGLSVRQANIATRILGEARDVGFDPVDGVAREMQDFRVRRHTGGWPGAGVLRRRSLSVLCAATDGPGAGGAAHCALRRLAGPYFCGPLSGRAVLPQRR